MATAEIIAIGTELLLGHTLDTNTAFIAKKLNEIGIDIFRASLIGDNIGRISLLINEALIRSDIVITTGGLGPTVDDPTRQAVADAMQTDLEFQPSLWDQIQNRFRLFNRTPTENNKRQAYIPRGAVVIDNPVGTAPAFYYLKGEKMIVSMPGVPAEMEYLLHHRVIPIFQAKFPTSHVTYSRILRTAGIGESSLDEIIGKFETMANPTVGLTAHPGQVDIRITAKAENKAKALEMIAPVEKKIRDLLGIKIYGIDDEKMEDKLQELLDAYSIKTNLFANGLGDALIEKIRQRGLVSSITDITGLEHPGIPKSWKIGSKPKNANSLVIMQSSPLPNQCLLIMSFQFHDHHYLEERSFGFHADSWDPLIEFYLYNFMRESILKEKGE